MYKIEFNPRSCQWEIKLNQYLVCWVTLKGKSFPNYESAIDYVEQVGLDKVYKPYGRSLLGQMMAGAA
jgi:hypothetical protein